MKIPKELQKKLEEFAADNFEILAPKFSDDLLRQLDATIPLMTFTKTGKPTPRAAGSGTLVTIADHTFIFTAAHVIEEFNHIPVIVTDGEKFFNLEGESFRTALPESGTHYNDNYDAAVFHIQGEIPTSVKSMALTLKDFHHPNLQNEGIGALMTGFPLKKCKVSHDIVDFQRITLLLEDISTTTQKHDSAIYITLRDDKKWIGNQGIKSRESLVGTSGGGVWKTIHNQGVLTGHYLGSTIEESTSLKSIIGIRFHVHLTLIAKFLPELVHTIDQFYQTDQETTGQKSSTIN